MVYPMDVYDQDVIATRGDRLVLSRDHAETQDFVVDLLRIVEVDEDGRCTRTVLFDADDLDAAYAELDTRFASGEAADSAAMVRLPTRLAAAFNDRDWERFRSMLAEDLAVVDHRLAGTGRFRGADAFVEAVRPLADVIANAVLRIPVIYRVCPVAGALFVRGSGQNAEGGEVELEYIGVASIDGERLVSYEYFPTDRLVDALARYQELAEGI
jgi:hypothetical protein